MKKTNDKKLLIILTCVVVVLLAGFIGLVVYSNLSSNHDYGSSDFVEDKEANEAAMHQQLIADAYSKLNIKTDFRKSLTHGSKDASYQKWIVLHDTEGDGRAENVVSG